MKGWQTPRKRGVTTPQIRRFVYISDDLSAIRYNNDPDPLIFYAILVSTKIPLTSSGRVSMSLTVATGAGASYLRCWVCIEELCHWIRNNMIVIEDLADDRAGGVTGGNPCELRLRRNSNSFWSWQWVRARVARSTLGSRFSVERDNKPGHWIFPIWIEWPYKIHRKYIQLGMYPISRC